MACVFKGNQTPTKMSPKKLNAANLKPESSPLKQELYKEHEKSQGLKEADLKTVSPRRLDFVTEDKPAYNKENLLHGFKEVETHNVDSSELQDSGYSSVLHDDSPYQANEDSPSLDLPSTVSANLFPALHFEEVVCSTLKKCTKRSPKVDWDLVDEVISRGNFGLENLIGKKMGLERMDILGELFRRDFKHLLTKILRHLSEKEAKLSVHAATRDSALGRMPLASVQKVATASCCFSSKKKLSNKSKFGCSSHSRHSDFNEVAKTLNNDQSLKVCKECGSPAKYDSYLHRAICTRESCKQDFCTLCHCDYHFSKSCSSTNSQAHRYFAGPLPGSKKSKQNLRRL
uniref:F-box protein 5 n=1 Tax=Leptobrachium leishanense TaxID=445787 RepID=A0A8C5QDL3_9ANUR